MDRHHSACLRRVLANDKQKSENLSFAQLSLDCAARSELVELFSKNSNARQSIETEIQNLEGRVGRQKLQPALLKLRENLKREFDVNDLSVCTST